MKAHKFRRLWGIFVSSTSPTPTIIFVNQSEISTRLVFVSTPLTATAALWRIASFPSLGAPPVEPVDEAAMASVGFAVLGMQKMKPSKNPPNKEAPATRIPTDATLITAPEP